MAQCYKANRISSTTIFLVNSIKEMRKFRNSRKQRPMLQCHNATVPLSFTAYVMHFVSYCFMSRESEVSAQSSQLHSINYSQSNDEDFVGRSQLAEVCHRQQEVEDRVRHHQHDNQRDNAANSHHVIVVVTKISSTVRPIIFLVVRR